MLNPQYGRVDVVTDKRRGPTTEEQLLDGVNKGRVLDGLPPLKKARVHAVPPHEVPIPDDDDDDEDLLYLKEFDYQETVYLARKEDIVEKRISPEERRAFDEAKDEALRPWIENWAWQAVDRREAEPHECCPLRFLLKWKQKGEEKKASARVTMQGFKHGDVLTQKLDTEVPTLPRLGRNVILQVACTMHWKIARTMHWKIFVADVKSAFLQADDIVETENLRIFGIPGADMRRHLERLMGLRPDQILRMRKPTFGDVRAPKLWRKTVGRAFTERGFRPHVLKACVYLSYREATTDDATFTVWQKGNQEFVLDGVIGLHVDDMIGCGEGVHQLTDLENESETTSSFRERLTAIRKRFKFGEWDFSGQFVYGGGELQQTPDYTMIEVRQERYLHKVKPLTVEKHRRAQGMDECSGKENSQLRSLIGVAQWLAAQGVAHAAG